MPDRVPVDMLDRMLEDMPDRMPDRMPLDDGWPESEKDVFQAALRMVVVKDSG